MKSENLELKELLRFDRGFLTLLGRRVMLHDLHAFAMFRKDLIQSVGDTPARQILTRYGFFCGQADAAAMKRVFTWDSKEELLKAGPILNELQGLAKNIIKSMHYDEAKNAFLMEITWHNSSESEEHLTEFGLSHEPVCWILTGYASGYASYCLDTEVYFIESKCRAKGDRICTATGKDKASWGAEIEPFLQYFKSSGINRKIKLLTTMLQKRSQQLIHERKKHEMTEIRNSPVFIESRSKTFQEIIYLANRIARFETTVLITGESGTGKEVMAKYIHRLSDRSEKPFIAINCSALPETLLESELFGHKAGSFTGAIQDRKGLFEEAADGTIFLDEIGDISPALQVRLLRVLQEKEITRVGENVPRQIKARVIAATNQNLEERILKGYFREDLFYRLAVVNITIPPLRKRKEDILILARHFVKKLSQKLNLPDLSLDAACIDVLQSYLWPGNIRELENILEYAAVICQQNTITQTDLPTSLLHAPKSILSDPAIYDKSLEQVEYEHIQRILKFTNGNQLQTAKILKISPSTLWRKLKTKDKK